MKYAIREPGSKAGGREREGGIKCKVGGKEVKNWESEIVGRERSRKAP